MQDIIFPLDLTFKITTLSNDFIATDANQRTIAYIRSKLFKLKEDIEIFADETKTKRLYTIKANKWIDFSASYNFADDAGTSLGNIARKGWASIWKAHYEIFDTDKNLRYTIHEENGWVKVLDALFGEIPILGMFTGYMFNPSYSIVDNKTGEPVAQLKKKASFFGRRFNIYKLAEMPAEDQTRVLLGCMMMILLERQRG